MPPRHRHHNDPRDNHSLRCTEAVFTALTHVADQFAERSWRTLLTSLANGELTARPNRVPAPLAVGTQIHSIEMRDSQARTLLELAREFHALNARGMPSLSALITAIAAGDVLLERVSTAPAQEEIDGPTPALPA